MNITQATYGDHNVLNIVQSSIRNNILRICASNQFFNKDPNPGTVKYLKLTIDDIEYTIKENEYFTYPQNLNTKKLGIFYSNNNFPKVVEYCLKNLIKFENKADIISCVWKHIPNNPFHEIIAYTQHSHHLNIGLQILQLLYFAQQHGEYDFVSFLEHDVLYPDDYFNFYDIHPGYDGLVNENYIGLCDKGFQQKNQNDLPLHQITMRFNDAITHFEAMTLKAIKERSVVFEPKNLQKRSCKYPSLHINHGRHFTSHHSIYSTTNTYTNDEAWGDGIELMKHIIIS